VISPNQPLESKIPRHPVKAVVFDLDGTLVDTLGDFEQAINFMLNDLNLPLASRQVVEKGVGKGTEHLLRTVLTHQTALSSQACQSADKLYRDAYVSYLSHYQRINGHYSQLYPGVLPGLQELQQRGLAIACLTNKPIGFAEPLLKHKGIRSYFSKVYGGDSFAEKKPHPLPLLKTCEALGIEPCDTLMLGDSSNDAQAARAAGCPVFLVSYGYNHGMPIQDIEADAYLDHFLDLLNSI